MKKTSKLQFIADCKKQTDKSTPFGALFGGFGPAIAVIGILYFLVKGIKLMDWDPGTGMLTIVGGCIGSWIVGWMICGFASMIDGILRTQAYTRIIVEYLMTKNGDEIDIVMTKKDGDYDTPPQKLNPIIIEDKLNTWMCPSCGVYMDFKHRVCNCGYAVPSSFVFPEENLPLLVEDNKWRCPECWYRKNDPSCRICKNCNYVIPDDFSFENSSST